MPPSHLQLLFYWRLMPSTTYSASEVPAWWAAPLEKRLWNRKQKLRLWFLLRLIIWNYFFPFLYNIPDAAFKLAWRRFYDCKSNCFLHEMDRQFRRCPCNFKRCISLPFTGRRRCPSCKHWNYERMSAQYHIRPDFYSSMGISYGAEGAGLATFLSNCIACLYFFIYLLVKRNSTFVCIHPKKFYPAKLYWLGYVPLVFRQLSKICWTLQEWQF